MKLYPSKIFFISIPGDTSTFLEKMTLLTEHSSNLATKQTTKPFIGDVNERGFKIINSVVGFGSIAVFRLDLSSSAPQLTVSLNFPFKIILAFLLVFLFGGVLFSMLSIGLPKGLGLLVPLIMGIVFIRFILFGLLFTISKNLGIDKLKSLTEIIID